MDRRIPLLIIGWIGCVASTAAAADTDLYADNVVIVLDGSGSMREPMPGTKQPKMAAAKIALKAVLANLPASTQVGLAAFSSKPDQVWLQDLGPQKPAELNQAIDGIRAGGKTPLGRYLKLAADRLLEQRAKQYGYGTYRLLVVTDGEASDQKLVNLYTPDLISRGITLDVIGVNMKAKHTLAESAHSYRKADDPESLQRAIEEVFAEVSNTDSDDNSDENAFELLSGIPTEVAVAMTQALVTSGNHPIGVRPASAVPSAPKKVASVTQQDNVPVSVAMNGTPGSSRPGTVLGFSWRFWGFMALVAFGVAWVKNNALKSNR